MSASGTYYQCIFYEDGRVHWMACVTNGGRERAREMARVTAPDGAKIGVLTEKEYHGEH